MPARSSARLAQSICPIRTVDPTPGRSYSDHPDGTAPRIIRVRFAAAVAGDTEGSTDVRATRALLGLCLTAALLSGCGGSNGGASSTGGAADATEGGGQVNGGETAATASQTAKADLPAFMTDFDRVCETQVGFGAAAAYDATPGTHPVVLFTDFDDPPTLVKSGVTLPAGWTVAEDEDYANNSELAGVQLVACSRRVSATPNGTKCDFKASDSDTTTTLELTDTVYKLTVYAAATGKQVGEPQALEASTTECPYFATFHEGDTQYLNDPTEDQYINALKGVVNP
jgi:hypothetical protein